MLKACVHCPDCNREFANPEYKDGIFSVTAMAVSGVSQRAHSPQLGIWELEAMRWWLAFLRGAGTTLLILAIRHFRRRRTVLQIWREQTVNSHSRMALMCGYGLWALLMAWLWSGIDGPVGKLLPRAYGIALGFLLPAVFALLAIRLRWVAYPVDVARCSRFH